MTTLVKNDIMGQQACVFLNFWITTENGPKNLSQTSRCLDLVRLVCLNAVFIVILGVGVVSCIPPLYVTQLTEPLPPI